MLLLFVPLAVSPTHVGLLKCHTVDNSNAAFDANLVATSRDNAFDIRWAVIANIEDC